MRYLEEICQNIQQFVPENNIRKGLDLLGVVVDEGPNRGGRGRVDSV